MKRWGWASLLVVALLAASVVPGEAGGRRHHRHHHVRGPRVFVGFGFGPAWWHPYPYWYYPPAYVYAPPTVIVREPPVYIEQQPVPPAGSAPAAAQQYWYYCEPAGGYYPGVQTCSAPWVKVPARPQE
jgi:hypothetical protein